MGARRQFCGFSLVEVIIAAGIFAGAMATTIALMAVLSRQSAEAIDHLAATRLPDAVKIELDRLAATDFGALAAQVPELAASPGEGLALVASPDGAQVQSLAYLPPAAERLAANQQYYLIECWRFPEGPLRYDSTKAFLALQVRVSWPYRLAAQSSPVPMADRSQLTFTVSLNR